MKAGGRHRIPAAIRALDALRATGAGLRAGARFVSGRVEP